MHRHRDQHQHLNLLRTQWLHERKRRLEDIKSRFRSEMESCRILNAQFNAVIHIYHTHLLDQIKQLSTNFEDWHEEILNALDDDDLLYILDHLLNKNLFA